MLRKIAFWAFVAVLVLWLVNDPQQAGGLATGVFHWLDRAGTSVGTLVSSIGGK